MSEHYPVNTILQGDTLSVLRTLPDNYIQTCVTSPPYYGLRSYLPDGHADKHLEIGLEETPDEYIEKLVQVFREVRRVLRPDGICWINLGSSYISHTIESEEYILRDDLTPEELIYVYSELAKCQAEQSETMSNVREDDASAKQNMPDLFLGSEGETRELRSEEV